MLALAPGPLGMRWLQRINPNTESLDAHYKRGKPRLLIYQAMVERIISCVRQGFDVCVVSYGHPGWLAHATHESLRLARAEGYRARMSPAVSSLDCLLADIGIDPGDAGCQSHEATHFLLYKHRVDPTCPLVLFQIAVTGELRHTGHLSRTGLRTLAAVLAKQYGADHEVVLYEAPQYPVADPMIQRLVLRDLPKARMSTFSTLYVPPKRKAGFDAEMFKRLGLHRQRAFATS